MANQVDQKNQIDADTIDQLQKLKNLYLRTHEPASFSRDTEYKPKPVTAINLKDLNTPVRTRPIGDLDLKLSFLKPQKFNLNPLQGSGYIGQQVKQDSDLA